MRCRPRERALLCRVAEVEFVGVPCGIMDQFAVTLCRRGHALFLDCRSLETHHIPLGSDLAIAVCDTTVARTLAGSAYAQRRQECEQAVTALQQVGLRVQSHCGTCHPTTWRPSNAYRNHCAGGRATLSPRTRAWWRRHGCWKAAGLRACATHFVRRTAACVTTTR